MGKYMCIHTNIYINNNLKIGCEFGREQGKVYQGFG